MKLTGCLAVAALTILIPLNTFADSSNISFSNSDGDVKSNSAQTTLSLVGSQLFAVQGMNNSFGPGYDCAGSCGPGSSIAFTTGTVIGTRNRMGGVIPTTLFPTGGYINGVWGTGVTTFGANTSPNAFMVTENPGSGLLGFTFSGGFSSESWSCVTGQTCQAATQNGVKGFSGTWAFQGTIVNGVLTVDGQKFNIPNATTFDLTTTSGFVKNPGSTGVITFIDSTGGTSFPSPVPEPSSLALFGTGLIALGILTRRVTTARTSSIDVS